MVTSSTKMKKLIATIVSLGVVGAILGGCGSAITEEAKPAPAATKETSKGKSGGGAGGGGMIPDFTDDKGDGGK